MNQIGLHHWYFSIGLVLVSTGFYIGGVIFLILSFIVSWISHD